MRAAGIEMVTLAEPFLLCPEGCCCARAVGSWCTAVVADVASTVVAWTPRTTRTIVPRPRRGTRRSCSVRTPRRRTNEQEPEEPPGGDKPEPHADEPEPTAGEPEPTADEPEPHADEPEPTADAPEPTADASSGMSDADRALRRGPLRVRLRLLRGTP